MERVKGEGDELREREIDRKYEISRERGKDRQKE